MFQKIFGNKAVSVINTQPYYEKTTELERVKEI